jgi:hypothetical protein
MAKIDDNQKRMEADRKTNKGKMKQEIRTGQKHMQEMIRTSQEKMEVAIQSIQSEMDETIQQRVENVMKHINHKTEFLESLPRDDHFPRSDGGIYREDQPDPRMMQSISEHQEVPKEEATVMLVGGLRKQHRTRIWLWAATRSRRERSRQIVDLRRD